MQSLAALGNGRFGKVDLQAQIRARPSPPRARSQQPATSQPPANEQAFAEELHQNSICRCAQTAISALSLDVREPPDLMAGDPLKPVSTLERVELVLSGDVVCVQVGHTAPVADVKYSIRQLQGDSRE